MAIDYAALLEAFLSKPKSATVDGQSVTNYSPSELRELIRLAKEQELAEAGDLGVRFIPLEYRSP